MSGQDVHDGHRPVSNPNVGCVDFCYVDSMEFLNYLPIYQQLPNSMMVAVPQPEWFDLDRAVVMFKEAGVAYQHKPSPNAACVITTQCQREIFVVI